MKSPFNKDALPSLWDLNKTQGSRQIRRPTLFESVDEIPITTIADFHPSDLVYRRLLELSWCLRSVLRHRSVFRIVIRVCDLLDHSERVRLGWIVAPALLAIERPKQMLSIMFPAHNQSCHYLSFPGVTGDEGALF